MNCIRTKNKILLADHEDNSWYYVWDIRKKAYLVVSKKQTIKQADTIEELCDEFVVYVKDNKLLTNLGDYESCYEWYHDLTHRTGLSKVDASMFGAIWTDKGLIYVAKMNDKGELELL